MSYWLLKTEPETYSYLDLEKVERDRWNGVRNFTALNHLRQMRPGDLAFIYHTGQEKAIVGIAEVVSLPYPDPAETDSRFVVVDIKARQRLNPPVTLRQIKQNPLFAAWELVRMPRLSVMPVRAEYWQTVIAAAGQYRPVST
ncbi:hypothetical protein P22_1802 [Propionispora sp. 2/2-37]|uniref:EVE domain-containing protein n=1 Tax=Propionispora sp. 2/2-37 TaxID=1677858 RepID=UPI0006BB5491|nr:EVE domain-containing protein [Propionispora sp. 2/2-37]CUH95722.1 hypothetical protein P22_1802 [Propionispora sp. 2/2-37]